MTLRNRKPLALEYEPAGPLCGRFEVDFRAMNAACDRWLGRRGLVTQPSFRKSGFLFGSKKRRAAA